MELTYLFEPKADESPLGYYRRLASANALWTWKELAIMAQVSPSRTGLLGRPEHVAAMLKVPGGWTQALADQESGLRALRSLHRARHDAVCPMCLADDVYLRICWEHAYVTVCVKHKVRLIDRCTACGEYFTPTRERIDVCHCGRELRLMPTQVASTAQIWVSSLLSSGGSDCGGIAPHVSGVDAADVAHLVGTLCQLFAAGSAPPRRNAAGPKTVNEAVEFLSPLEELLRAWPASYEAHVRMRIAAGPPHARTLRALLGMWYQQIRAVTVNGPLKVFLSPILNIAGTEFDGLVGIDDVDTVQDLLYVRLSVAASYSRVGISALRRGIGSGQIAHRIRLYGTRGKVYEVLRSDLDKIVTARAGWMTEDVARRKLDVPAKVLSNMAGAGLLEADYDWNKDVMKGGPVNAASLDKLVARLMSQQVATAADGDLIALKELTSRRLGDNTAIQALMRAIKAGEVAAQGRADRIGDLKYPLSEVRRFFGTPMLEAGLSVSQLAKLTGWKHESIDHWITQGPLQSHSIVLRGQPCRVVMPAQLLEFTRSYVPLADLSRMVGTRSRHLAKELHEVEVIPGKIVEGGAQRGTLVKMADIVRLALRKNAVVQ